jgi:hypothetical protein
MQHVLTCFCLLDVFPPKTYFPPLLTVMLMRSSLNSFFLN